ncbi:hypothetical protein [Salinirubrum litoreum]|uniref:Uncharacterized protein n=1 Tax=Salinirubrum litoreum TaxID=1126234 RepID=A0ABD5RE87_9EURY|nr:hypothetical protein [Salinirubrum litoreum]
MDWLGSGPAVAGFLLVGCVAVAHGYRTRDTTWAATTALRWLLAGLLVVDLSVLTVDGLRTLATGGLLPVVVPFYPHYVAVVLLHPLLLSTLFGVDLTARQSLWITLTLFLHPFGVAYGVYDAIWWFDHLTHFLSATLVGSIAYVAGRAYQLSTDRPARHGRLVALALVAVVAGGLFWEAYEIFEGRYSLYGFEIWKSPLVVYGPGDTFWDLVFNLFGWLTVALFGRRALEASARGVARQFAWRPRDWSVGASKKS